MDIRTGETYETREEALKAGVPDSDRGNHTSRCEHPRGAFRIWTVQGSRLQADAERPTRAPATQNMKGQR